MWRLRIWWRRMKTAGVCRHCGCVLDHATNTATLRVDPDVLVCPHCDNGCHTPRCQVCASMLGNVRIVKRDDEEQR